MKPQIAPIGNYRKTARCLIRREERNFEFIKSINLLMVTLNRVRQYLIVSATAITAFSCSARLLETDPDILTDTSKVTITCNGSEGNAGLLNYSGEVYVHLGLITSKSEHRDDWRYVKFTWGSMQQEAGLFRLEKTGGAIRSIMSGSFLVCLMMKGSKAWRFFSGQGRAWMSIAKFSGIPMAVIFTFR
jgi:hypothetical protein